MELSDNLDGKLCTICLDNDITRNMLRLKCGHYFHQKCLYEWVIQDKEQHSELRFYEDVVPLRFKCPLCRRKLNQIFDLSEFDNVRILEIKKTRKRMRYFF